LPSAKFLQLSDLHLGAPFGWLPAPKRRVRQAEQRRALEHGIEAAIHRGADAILVPGDLFDREAVDSETLAFTVHAFAREGCPPVYIAPGNHDPWSGASPCWSTRLLEARGWAWPAHVHVFGSAEWSARPVEGKPIQVWGRCFSAGVSAYQRPLEQAAIARIPPLDPAHLHVALFHGAREGFRPASQKIAGPFSDAEAIASPFTYLAAGHYHVHSHLEEGGRRRLAYAGSLVAVDATELGRHGALEVRIAFGEGAPVVELEPIALDPRDVREVPVDVTGASSAEQIDERIARALDQSDVSVDDIVTVRLLGRMMKGVRHVAPGAGLESRAFWLKVDRRATRPDYDLASYHERDPLTTEDRFVHAMLARLEQTTDPDERGLVESALFYGLDAFRLREVVPAYEDLGT
jgi:DNA repair exonuclease SbcCD nuclease subunit